ncbi:MAG: tetratricopeptide repeat protein, partial [Bacteroidales bacterium]|nr:tetratricopeptide repeat protein [Bacteroidales bacterium]
MKTKLFLLLVFFLATIKPSLAFQEMQDHRVLFEKAKYTMETKADLEEAITLFELLINTYPDEKEYAAKAQYHIGLCYEKLGLNQAQKAYQKVVENYPEQSEAVKLANEKLSLLLRAQTVIQKGDKEFKIRQIWAGSDVDDCGAPSPDG